MKFLKVLAALLVLLPCFCPGAAAQFKKEGLSQNSNDKGAPKDTTDRLFDPVEFWSGITHKDYGKEVRLGTMFAGSTVFLGAQQINNRDYWKLPILYGGIGAGVGLGVHFNKAGNSSAATWCFVGAGLTYWAGLLDGAISFKTDKYPHAGKATVYSILVPGLGQAYNGEYWKIPIYVGGLGAAVHYSVSFTQQFNRFRNIYLDALEQGSEYSGAVTSDVAKYYRDIYRRYRDYAYLSVLLVYLIQVIDANVFSYMHDFNVNDDLTLNVAPGVVGGDLSMGASPALGVNLALRF